ncbi:MAG: NAD-dependent DNA ligase LigA [Mycobacterium sp.]
MNRDEFQQLVSDLTAAAAAYYESDVLLMTDAQYDAGIDSIQRALVENPEWGDAESAHLLDQVAAGQSAGGEVTHPTRMLSLDKVTLPGVDDDRSAVLAEIDRFIAAVDGAAIVEPKMDGLALRAEYVNGFLVMAATRGDGTTGEDVTANVLRGAGVVGLPAELLVPWGGEVRGEVVMSVTQFEQAQVLRAERGGKPFVNARNATAGALRKSGDEHWMPLTFVAYDIDGGALSESHVERMNWAARELNFTVSLNLVPNVPTDPVEALARIEGARPDLGFDIDGAVIKADRNAVRAALGEGSRTPNWALAVKFPAEEASAVVEDIEVSVGRTGRIGLRARITPTFVAGTTVTYATLHNPSWVTEQGIGIGSRVVLKRAGDVIPRITAPLDGTGGEVAAWTPPPTCPQCGEPWNTDSLLWRCETPSCGLVNAIDYAFSRDCLDAEGVGGAVSEAMVESGLVADLADVFTLTVDQLATLPMGVTGSGATRHLGLANAVKVHAQIEASKTQPFNRVITALGIRLTGRTVGRWLARHYGDMASLRAADADHIAELPGMGPAKAAAVVDGLTRLGPVIDRLAAGGVNMGDDQVGPSADHSSGDLPLAGKSFVVSGSVPGHTRTTAQEAIEAAGGRASGSVSKTTTALITDETTTSKAKKAADLGVPIIDPVDFEALLRGEIL